MKTNVTLSLDMDIIAEYRMQKLPISNLVNDFLISYLKIPQKKEEKYHENIEVRLATAKAEVAKLQRKRDKIIREYQTGKRITLVGGK